MTEILKRSSPRRATVVIAVLLGTTVLSGGIAIGEAWSATEHTPAPTAIVAPQPQPYVQQAGFADLAAKVKPAVVNIAVTERVAGVSSQSAEPGIPEGSPFADMFRRFSQPQPDVTRHAEGSGFIVDPAGYIVTNNHVVDGAKTVTVTLDDGSSYTAVVKGRDAKTDLALLKVDAEKPLPFVSFAETNTARVGDWVIAVGNPFGLGGTVTAGIISAHDRDINAGPYDDFLQIDAAINPGNSGGPLFDQSGRVIGIDTAIYSPSGGSVGIGFAIPSTVATNIVAQLREHGTVERGWLGVQMQPMNMALAKAIGRPDATGVLVDQIEPNSPASKADLKQGDVIMMFNGTAVKNPRDLAMMVAGMTLGDKAKVSVWRDGRERSLEVTVGDQPLEHTAAADVPSDEAPVGLGLSALSPEYRDRLGLASDAEGVVVSNVTPDSRADASGIRPGDVIVRVGNEAVTAPRQVADKVKAAERAKKEAVSLLVMRDGATYYLALQLDKA